MQTVEQSYWEGRSCLVTGGAGFIGSSLVEKLVNLGSEVTVIDDLSAGKQNIHILERLNVNLIKASVVELGDIKDYFKNVDTVFHLAAMNRAQKSIKNPLLANSINITGTLNCLKLASDNKVRRFVFASSSSVYKGVIGSYLKEDMYLEPLHPYGVGKLAGEHYCRVFNNIFKLKTTILRYFSVYGPRQRPDIDYAGVVAKFVNASLKDKPLTIYGDGKQKRNFSYIADIADGTLRSSIPDETIGEVINLASEEEYSIIELANTIINITGSNSEIVHLPALKGDPERNSADISRARELIGYEPQYSLEQGLRETVQHFDVA